MTLSSCCSLQNVIQTQKWAMSAQRTIHTLPAGGFLQDTVSSTRSKIQTWLQFNRHAKTQQMSLMSFPGRITWLLSQKYWTPVLVAQNVEQICAQTRMHVWYFWYFSTGQIVIIPDIPIQPYFQVTNLFEECTPSPFILNSNRDLTQVKYNWLLTNKLNLEC